jgi:hypothetical protein
LTLKIDESNARLFSILKEIYPNNGTIDAEIYAGDGNNAWTRKIQ